MLKELKFVMGAVAKKDFVAAMTHFSIENGRVSSYNGKLALSSPIDFTINCKPKAQTLVRAISQCEDTIVLAFTKAGRLQVKSGAFSASIECLEEESPHIEPEGEEFNINGEQLLTGLKKLQGFIGDDASRPWSNGVLLSGSSAFATNNTMVVEYWLGCQAPMAVNIPRDAVREMIRINEPPTLCQVNKDSISFHYEDGKWIRSQLLATQWPDLAPLLNRESNPIPVDERMFEAIDSLKGFTSNLSEVYLEENGIRTSRVDGEGASYDIPGLRGHGCFSTVILDKLRGIADRVDFSPYPQPCTFFGENLRGVFAGISAR